MIRQIVDNSQEQDGGFSGNNDWSCVTCWNDARSSAYDELTWARDKKERWTGMGNEQVEYDGIPLDPEDIILLLIEANERVLGKTLLSGVTRLEKLIFLLQKETEFKGIREFYEFKAHNFGPFSKGVYEAVDFLTSCELLEVKERGYRSYYAAVGEELLQQEISADSEEDDSVAFDFDVTEKLFALTENGQKVAEKLRDLIGRHKRSDIDELDSIIRKYGNLPLNQLIRYVYRQYREMTEKSIHPEARRL